MSDAIELRGVRARGFHGVLPAERAEGQDFVVDATLWFDTRRAAARDDVAETVDYAEVASSIAAEVTGEPVDLIETLAARIAARLLRDPRLDAVEVVVHKPQAPIPLPFDDVAVRIRRERPRRAVLGLGSNLGERVERLRAAVSAMRADAGTQVLAVSPVYETAPVGGPDQPDYLNAVVLIETDRSPRDLLRLARRIEREGARQREQRWGPRTIDVDVIDIDGVISSHPRLTLPHPRAHERVFVLQPWLDLDPDAVLAGVGSVHDVLTTLDRSGVRRTDFSIDIDS